MMKSLFSILFPSKPGDSDANPIDVTALPGLTTFLDVALFHANEGQLTASICSSHALLACWLDAKYQSQSLLQSLVEEESDSSAKLLCESFCRQCLESSMDALERLSTDKLSQTANLSDPYDSTSATAGAGGHHNLLSGVGAQGIVTGILESKEDIGRRYPLQRYQDCWESPRLFCPDYVWADDAYQACQRWIRNLTKHPFVLRENDTLVTSNNSSNYSNKQLLDPSCERQASILIQLIQDDLPMRLYHFRQAMEKEALVTKRLYLVKCEYRAPLRHFLEAHQSLLRAPSMELVDSYLKRPSSNADGLKSHLQSLLQTPELVELFALEKECEQIELDMGQALFPFSELARSLDHKKARLKVVPGVVEEDELAGLQETVRRLKCILCRKGGPETSTGIRPILLDLKSIPRDDEVKGPNSIPRMKKKALDNEVKSFLSQLQCLSTLIQTRNAFRTMKKGGGGNQQDIDFSYSVVKGCTEQFDIELLKCQLLDWFAIVEHQQAIKMTYKHIPDEIRKAEMKMSIAGATKQSLNLVKERLELMMSDRQQRLEVLQEMVEEVCWRETNLHVRLNGPDPQQILELKETSAPGFLGIPLQLAGEPLPVG